MEPIFQGEALERVGRDAAERAWAGGMTVLRPDGSVAWTAASPGAAALSHDGTRVAWLASGRLVVTDLEASRLVAEQDLAMCEAVQRGYSAGIDTDGRLSPEHELGVAHVHGLLRAALGPR